MAECTVAVLNPRSRRPFADHSGLTAAEAQELVRVYRALGHAEKDIRIVTSASRPSERAA
jgi:hypothetical protein